MTKLDKKAIELIKAGVPTPFYIYDFDIVQKKIRDLQNTFHRQATILYSMKCNPNFDILKLLSKNKKLWIDVCSIGEAKRAIKSGFSYSRMSFVGPAKSEEELRFCIRNNVSLIIIESEQELESLNKLSLKFHKKINIMIRVAMRKTMSLSGKVRDNHETHFGISEDHLDSVLKKFNSEKIFNHIFLAGIHCYVQSNYADPHHIGFNFKSAINIFKSASTHFSQPLDNLNLGGGFGVDYFQDQTRLDLKKLKKIWADLYNAEFSEAKIKTRFFVESGRYLMAESGSFYSKVMYSKKNYEKNYLILDGGFTQNMSSTGYGQILKRNPIIRVVAKKGKATHKKESVYTVVGPSCFSADVLARDFPLTNISIGSLIAVDKSGAYGASFSPQNFLLRPEALEFVVNG